MEIKDYFLLIGQKLEAAKNTSNKEEWVRLAKILIEFLRDQIEGLEK